MSNFEDVKQFKNIFGQRVITKPQFPDEKTMKLRFDLIKEELNELEEAMKVTDDFGRDARSIMRTIENIKDPEQVEKAIKEDVDKIKVLNK